LYKVRVLFYHTLTSIDSPDWWIFVYISHYKRGENNFGSSGLSVKS